MILQKENMGSLKIRGSSHRGELSPDLAECEIQLPRKKAFFERDYNKHKCNVSQASLLLIIIVFWVMRLLLFRLYDRVAY